MSYHPVTSPEEVWDRAAIKLLILICESQELRNVSKKDQHAEPVVGDVGARVYIGRLSHKTNRMVASHTSVWNEFAFFDLSDPELQSAPLQVEVFQTKKGTLGAKKSIGECIICATAKELAIEPHKVIDKWYTLQKDVGKKSPSMVTTGRIRLRLYYAIDRETKPSYIRKVGEDIHYYDQYKKQMKTGDLILYNETGLLPTMMKLASNSSISRVGMVLILPNKYTEKKKRYILEITRNTDKFQDAIRESAGVGVHIFRMRERLWEFPGTEVWSEVTMSTTNSIIELTYVMSEEVTCACLRICVCSMCRWLPLKEPLQDDPKQNMVEHILQIHSRRMPLELNINMPDKEFLELLSKFSLYKPPNSGSLLGPEFLELSSADFMARALRLGGRRIDVENLSANLKPIELVSSPVFSEPILLRCLAGTTPEPLVSKRTQTADKKRFSKQ
jgi:hypothetical protein